ncbi:MULTISPECIES: hypothetical protein [Empedobacter]|uniref:Uncharacterized protein n=1 Tax=Empedobacter falsenii TaxID=343874 RepID=A0A376G8E1_9FLAO|nr:MULTISPECIES: hypothetical protein [Empedobacter]MDH1602077.1 hypothetical protein [Empedobacter sp. GD03739]STD55752.1 Uncharacterised protein [Empedobacter falsenii]
MKKNLLFLVTFFISSIAFSQDIIKTHKDEVIKGKVIEVSDKEVKFQYEGESMINTLSKNLVSEIDFESGRNQKISDKVIINDEKDWEKVIITNLESDVNGLTRGEEIMAKASSGWSTTGEGKMQKLAMDKLKKEAAKKGYHVVLILTSTSKGGSYGISGGTKASVTGVGYKY